MTKRVDILVVGGGIAGLSAAARFAEHGKVVLLERESGVGFHSSGRSATFYHFGIGNDVVRGLTAASAAFFEAPPKGLADLPLWQAKPALFIADASTLDALEKLRIEMDRFVDTVGPVGPREMQAIVPVLRVGEGGAVAGLLDSGGRKLDADLLLQANAKALRRAGGELVLDAPVTGIKRGQQGWIVDTPGESYEARVLVNAAGAWADALAQMAGVRPLGLQPLRRTIIGFAPPDGLDISSWPFLKTAGEEEGFYMLPDAGKLLASPMDVEPCEPCDAQPEDYEMALAAWRVEQATTMKVERILARWAGLRSFVADKSPVAGFAPDAPGFFWLAGQGGFGLQTSPAMAMAAETLMFDLPWPDALRRHGLSAEQILPDRLFP